ncbi:MAG: ABC transporter ATP-binding protein [Microthrixaceae bacterium]
MATAVEVENLCIRYGELTAVDGLSLTAGFGEVTAVLGPNGAGKTSTIECCEGYRRPASGSVRVDGLDPVADHQALTERIGVMLQGSGLPRHQRPRDVLVQFAGFYPNPLDPDELLEQVSLTHRARSTWSRLSGGEQQRLSLALALVGRPSVAFLDEPSAGVDLEGRLLIRSLISRLRDDGVAVVLSTHDLDEAQHLADHIVIIDRGVAVAAGTPDDLLRLESGDEVRFGAQPGLDTGELTRRLGVEVSEIERGEYVMAAAGSPRLVADLTSALADWDVALADLRAGRKRLDDVFLRLTGEASAAATGTSPGEETT